MLDYILWVILVILLVYVIVFHFFLHGKPKPLNIDSYDGKHVIITGGSAGLGKSLAVMLSARGANITLISRSINKLKEVQTLAEDARKDKSQKILIFSSDVSKWNDLNASIAKAVEQNGVPDLVIANAGQSFPGYFLDIPIETLEKENQLNYMGVVYTIKSALFSMVKRNRGGHICIISSAASFTPMIGYANYTATKSAIRGLSDSLRNELLLYNIGVSIYFPTGIDTEGFANENILKPIETKEIESSAQVSTPADAARCLLAGLSKGQYYITNEVMTEFMRMGSHGINIPRNNFLIDLLVSPIAVFASPVVRFWMDSVVLKSKSKNKKNQ